MRRRLAVLALLLSLGAAGAGCVGMLPGDDAPEAERPPAGGAPFEPVPRAPLRDALPPADPPLVKRPLAVSLEVREPWVKPRQAFEARAEAPVGATLVWYAWAEGGDAFAREIDGFLYLGGAAAREGPVLGDHAHAPPPHEPLRSGPLAPGESTPPVAFPREGRYVLASDRAPHALVNVTVDPGVRAVEVAHATLVEDEAGVRWSPSEMSVRPTTRVRFWNAAEGTQAVSELRYLALLPSDAPALSFIGVDPGRYEIVALAREGADGWGEAARPVVVDFESPPQRLALGPYAGRVSSLATPDSPTTRAHDVRLPHDAWSVSFALRSASEAPAPHALAWRLLRDGEVVASAAPGEPTLEGSDLPAGDYVLEVEAREGVLVWYEVVGEARHRLEAPP